MLHDIFNDYRLPVGPDLPLLDGSAGGQVGECLARIEHIRMRLLSLQGCDDGERAELLHDLDFLRAAYLHMTPVCEAEVEPSAAICPVMDGADIVVRGILGQNSIVRENLDKIGRIAPTGLTVLIEGETGSGKELFAQIIHTNSRREKFVAVNCGAFPQGVIESELFGHVKGAFTGAHADRKGKFEEANHGTIFLDEVGELELQAQVKLLRVLDLGEIQRVGSDKVWRTDVRVIAATNRNLQEMVAEGTFREDLYYRLAICELRIPPLRERRDEIELLFEFFIQNTVEKSGRPMPELEPALRIYLFEEYDYPGNIRELKNLATYIAHMYGGRPLTVADLPERYKRHYVRPQDGDDDEVGPPPRDELLLRAVRDAAEREQLREILHRHGGSISAICADLKLSRSRVYQLFKKYDLKPDAFRALSRRSRG